MNKKDPLRFVILCDSLDFPKWQADCLKDAIASGLAVPVGIVIRESGRRCRNRWGWRSMWRKRHHALWTLFNKYYIDVFSKATVKENMSTYFHDVSKIYDSPVDVGEFAEALSDRAILFIKESRPHFVLRFGFGILKGAVLNAAPYGVWSYYYGDPAAFSGQPPGFREIYSGSPVAKVVLQVLTEEARAGAVLHAGFFQTVPHSYAKTRDVLFSGSSSWVRRTCAAIQENGWPLSHRAMPAAIAPTLKEPTNRAMVRFLIMTAVRLLRVHWTYRVFYQDWNCGVVPAPIHVVAGLAGTDEQARALEKTQWMAPPPRCFIADPFGYELGDSSGIRLLFEVLDMRKGIGAIGSACYSGNRFDSIRTILEEPTHLSYPFVFKDGDAIYYLPEHSAARDISAFRLTEAGDTDRKITLIPHSELVDSTIIHWNGKYWLLGTDQSKSSNTDLCVYYADSWRGPWFAHPLNPVKSDVRSSRPAGTPFVHNGKLYRPAQDCSTHYGAATVINEIVTLDQRNFEERPVARVQPWQGCEYRYGLHTLSAAGRFTLIDGARKTSRFW